MKNGLVQFILDSALRRAGQTEARSILACRIALGELAGITPESFRAQWLILARGTPAENAALEFNRPPAAMQCMVCFEKYHPRGRAPACPHCGSVGAKVLSGEQCLLESIRTDRGFDSRRE